MRLRGLFAPDPAEALHAEELQRTLVEDLYRRSATTVWFLVPLLFLFRSIIRNAYDVSGAVQWAFWSTVVIVVVRWLIVLSQRGDPPADTADVRRRYLRFHYLTIVMGLGIAATIFFAVPHVSFSQLALVCVFLTGVHSVALGSMAASQRTYLQYINPALLALIWGLVSRPRSGFENVLLGMIALYVPSLALMSLYVHNGLRRTILLSLELRDLALKDVLTGLPNRRFLREFMDHEAEQVLRSWREHRGRTQEDRRARPHPQSVALLLIDLDSFKSVNDEHGHAAGDEILRQVALVLQDAVRKPDLVVRWGGEEFVVVARDLSRDATGELAERIRKRLERHAFHLPSGETLLRTCSVGFSLLPFSVEAPLMLSWEHALSLADHALYRAKAAGRNCVVGVTSGEVAAANAEALMGALKDFDEALSLGLIRLSYSRPALSAE